MSRSGLVRSVVWRKVPAGPVQVTACWRWSSARILFQVWPAAFSATRMSRRASQLAYIDEPGMGNSPVIGVEGLLALVAAVQRWRDVQAGGGGEGDGLRYQQRQPCSPVSGLGGRGPALGCVPGGEPGGGGAPAESAGRADDPLGGGERPGRG